MINLSYSNLAQRLACSSKLNMAIWSSLPPIIWYPLSYLRSKSRFFHPFGFSLVWLNDWKFEISRKNFVANIVADFTWQYILEIRCCQYCCWLHLALYPDNMRCCQYCCWLHLAIYPGLSIMWERTLVTGRRPDTRGLSPSHHQTHKITLTQNSAHLQIETLQNSFEVLSVDYLSWSQFSAIIVQTHTEIFFALLEDWMRNTQTQFFSNWMMMTFMQVERILFITSIQSVTKRRWKWWWNWWWWQWWKWWWRWWRWWCKRREFPWYPPFHPLLPASTCSGETLRRCAAYHQSST